MVVRMRRVLRNNEVDAIICYTLGAHLPIAFAAWASGIPVLLHIGNAPPDDPSARRKIGLQLRLGRRFVRMHVACSQYVRDRVVRDYGMPPSDVVAIVNGIDLPAFLAVRQRPRNSGGPLQLGMIGSFAVHTDQATLIRALAALATRGVDVRLELVGRGTREQELKAVADSLLVADRITWTGTLSDVRDPLGRFDVFAYSVTDQEGLGIALIEALVAGVPCVGSDTGACREVLDNGSLGALVVEDTADAWADAILGVRGVGPVPVEQLARFDIGATALAYERLLGAGA
jgi:glycosyltransferase involved in cell wall biosynthesis